MIYEMFNYLHVLSADMASATGYGFGPGGYLLFMIIGVAFEFAMFGVYYTFRSIGLYKMAQNSGLIKPWLTVVPFFGIYACYKLSPNSKYIKKTPVFFILATVFGGMILAVNCLLDGFYGIPAIIKLLELSKTMGEADVTTLQTFASIFGTESYFATALSAYLNIVNVAYAVFMLLTFSRLFMSYTTKNANKFVLFSALVYFFGSTFLLAGIFVFSMRNKARVDYDAIFEARARFAQSASRQNYGNPFGGSPYGGNPYYGNQQRPYGGQQSGYGSQQPKDIDPFEEFNFSNTERGSDEVSEDTDDFFN